MTSEAIVGIMPWKPKYPEETCSSATLTTTKSILSELGSSQANGGAKPATNRLK
jgi:hypothetical protein